MLRILLILVLALSLASPALAGAICMPTLGPCAGNTAYSHGSPDNNTAIGFQALNSITSGTNNLAIGNAAGKAITTGPNNVLIGNNVGQYITSQGNNTGVGTFALSAVVSNNNTALGSAACQFMTSGGSNICIGAGSGGGLGTGSNNVILGNVGGLPSALSGAIIFGTGDGVIRLDFNKTAANTWTLGDSQHLAGAGTTAPTLSACGTGPSLSTGANDMHGTVTEGTSATGCTITFAQAYSRAPDCVVTSPTGTALTSYSTSTTALTLSNASASGAKFTWVCMGQ